MNVLVLGLGNILLSDEGVGVRAIERLLEHYTVDDQVDVVDGGTAGMDLLDIISGRDHVFIVDAVTGDDPAGTIRCLRNDEVPAYFRALTTPHQLGLCELLAILQITGEAPRQLTLWGIAPKSLDLGLELSSELGAQLDALVAELVVELRSLGITVTERSSLSPDARLSAHSSDRVILDGPATR